MASYAASPLQTVLLTYRLSQIVETKPANETYFSEEEVAACVDEGLSLRCICTKTRSNILPS